MCVYVGVGVGMCVGAYFGVYGYGRECRYVWGRRCVCVCMWLEERVCVCVWV